MHRTDLLKKLADYQTAHPNESKTTNRLAAFVEANTDCFERSLVVGHVTGSAWVVNQTGTHVLLTHHRKLDKWLQLGGHVDGNPDVLEAAMREAVEESGLNDLTIVSSDIFDIDIHLIPERKSEAAHYHHDVRFIFQATDSEDYIVSDESHDLAWVEIQRLEEYTNEVSMLRMAEKWLTR
jgi:8-oxo-dGTP pyrophosphatase MutT (NUDIX family)